jgi:hypothetical protein
MKIGEELDEMIQRALSFHWLIVNLTKYILVPIWLLRADCFNFNE